MSDYKDGYEAGGQDRSPMDAFRLSQYSDKFRVGYVMGHGESANVGTPAEYRYSLIGELAAKLRVPCSDFREVLEDDFYDDFKRGYLGE
ncbi:hypothetical protein EA796_06910 [Pseudomonas sp. AOB-7]|uniref:hypothetical protein n=1 Tax=Pseudomonas sp. AOB-7 TaxID=2482750 RepID=UPI000F2104A8|nr:hypothetical protein [Pseudomonas sp. AOB-7]RMH85233.1 hypothetical protein EA796_06910 [Pseudomonas sp. AOB-7]